MQVKMPPNQKRNYHIISKQGQQKLKIFKEINFKKPILTSNKCRNEHPCSKERRKKSQGDESDVVGDEPSCKCHGELSEDTNHQGFLASDPRIKEIDRDKVKDAYASILILIAFRSCSVLFSNEVVLEDKYDEHFH